MIILLPQEWAPSSAKGLLVENRAKQGAAEVWYSGRVIDLLHTGDDRLLVGTDEGGLWIAESDGTGRALSDTWVHPNVQCLAELRRRTGKPQYFCGTSGSLFMSDPYQADPLAVWIEVTLPTSAATVYRIVCLPSGTTVIATNDGIYWADINVDPNPQWNLASGTDDIAFSGLALAGNGLAHPRTPSGPAPLAAGTLNKGTLNPLYTGNFQNGILTFQPATMLPGLGAVPISMAYRFSIASCQSHPNHVYANCYYEPASGEVQLYGVFRSVDGGVSWQPLPMGRLIDPTRTLLPPRLLSFDHHEDERGHMQRCISVHPNDPNIVAIPTANACITDDGGSTWTMVGGSWKDQEYWAPLTDHWHTDNHMIRFEPTAQFPRRAYMATDGGVFRADDWKDPGSYHSLHNKGLCTLMFYSPSANLGFLGSIAVDPAAGGLLAGGLQDNGDVYKEVESAAPWHQIDGGDGGHNCMLAGHSSIWRDDGDRPHSSKWDPNTKALVDQGVIPVMDDAANLDHAGLVSARFEPITVPAYDLTITPFKGDTYPARMHALGWVPGAAGATEQNLYGLFRYASAGPWFWRKIGSYPGSTSIFCASSYDGLEVFMSTGKEIRVLDPRTGVQVLMSIDPVLDPHHMARFVVGRHGKAYLAFHSGGVAPDPVRIAVRAGTQWLLAGTIADPVPPKEGIVFGFGVDHTGFDPVLRLATRSRVWESRNDGKDWVDVSSGLPMQPHCTDLRFDRRSKRWYLGTYGRSMWQTRPQMSTPTSSDPRDLTQGPVKRFTS